MAAGTKQATNQGAPATQARSPTLTPELARRAVGQTCLYALPNGEVRPAIVVRTQEPTRADLRVFTLKEDASFFGGHAGVEIIQNAPYGAPLSPPGQMQLSHWFWPEQSQMATIWPTASQ